MKWLEFAFRNVWRNRRRSLVTIFIAALGAYSLLTSAGFGQWTYEALEEASTRENGHLVLSHPAFYQREEEVSMQLGLDNYQHVVDTLSADSRIKNYLPRIQFSGLISNGDKSAIYLGTGVDASEFSLKGPFLKIDDGKVLSESASVSEVMLGKDLAISMGAKIGSSLTLLATTASGALNAVDVQVVGVFSVGIPEVDKRAIYSSIGTAQELLGTKKVSTLSLFLDKTSNTDDVMHDIKTKLPELGVKPWWELAFYYESVKALYNRLFGVIGCIMLVLVFFSVYNTMSMTVIERTRETGTLAALGAYPFELTRNFLLEAFVIGLVGVLLGMAGAMLTSVILDHADVQMPPPPGRSTGYPLLIRKPLDLYLLVLMFAPFTCMVSAYFAARKGIKKPIVEALAHV